MIDRPPHSDDPSRTEWGGFESAWETRRTVPAELLESARGRSKTDRVKQLEQEVAELRKALGIQSR